ncbi:hypothetical protein H8R18_00765 [Nanchangia anserum]|uniref:DUF8175 domain-containing protein n=1 Tax=Nanchangia anserum TaxID=2692125 RepID=A0A8I0GBK6_9ACTO|nr:hypothetical protein [Nanchangia anserum]MBD3689773.1 hypothetical protein [Nanchangia anserum]QOX81947.1 hypothetical protein H8R18_00765 [Nanchangia anserum]
MAKLVAVPRWLIACVVVCVVCALGVLTWHALTRDSNANEGEAASASSEFDEGATLAGDDSESLCGLSDADQTGGPPEYWLQWDWEAYLSPMASAEGHGPGRVNDRFPTCYAHTPKGATLAAINWTALWESPWRVKTYRQRFTGKGSMRVLQRFSDSSERKLAAGMESVAVPWVRSEKYSDNHYRVMTVAAFPNGNWKMITHHVVWWKGDWYMYNAEGDWEENIRPVTQDDLDKLGGFYPTGVNPPDWE